MSDQIKVGEANRIDITVTYQITPCSNCVNVFDLYVNQSDKLIEDQTDYPDPLIDTTAYKKVAEIKEAINKKHYETITVLVKGQYAIIVFHNYGACSTLFSVKVTYNVCPGETISDSLVSLQKTVAPANDSNNVRVEGKCIKDAVQVSGSLFVHCDSKGEWNTTGLEGRCVCKEDMQNNEGKCEGNVAITIYTLEINLKMYMRLTFAVTYITVCYLGWLFCFLFPFRTIEVTLVELNLSEF